MKTFIISFLTFIFGLGVGILSVAVLDGISHSEPKYKVGTCLYSGAFSIAQIDKIKDGKYYITVHSLVPISAVKDIKEIDNNKKTYEVDCKTGKPL